MNTLIVLTGILLLCSGVYGTIGEACENDAACGDAAEICDDNGKCGKKCDDNTGCTEATQICTGTKKVCEDTAGEACDSDDKCGTNQACGDDSTCVDVCANNAACTEATQICVAKTDGGRMFCRVTKGKDCADDTKCGTNEACGDAGKCVDVCANNAACTEATEICEAKTESGRMFCRVTLDKSCAEDTKCGTDQACGAAGKCVAMCADDAACTALTQRCKVKSGGGTRKFCQDTLDTTCGADTDCGTAQKCKTDKCADTLATTCAADGDCGSAYKCSAGKKCALPCANDDACNKNTEKCLGDPKTCTMTLDMTCTKDGDCGTDQQCTGGKCAKKSGASTIGAGLILMLIPMILSLLSN